MIANQHNKRQTILLVHFYHSNLGTYLHTVLASFEENNTCTKK